MKRWLLVAAIAALCWFAGTSLWAAMASDETRIRWLFEDEASAFNGAAMLSILDGFAGDYRDQTTGVDRATLRAALLWAFQNRRELPSGRFRYRLELDPADMDVVVEGDRATVGFPLWLYERAGGEERLSWELRIDAGLERRQDGWKVVRSSHETLAGGRPR